MPSLTVTEVQAIIANPPERPIGTPFWDYEDLDVNHFNDENGSGVSFGVRARRFATHRAHMNHSFLFNTNAPFSDSDFEPLALELRANLRLIPGVKEVEFQTTQSIGLVCNSESDRERATRIAAEIIIRMYGLKSS